MKISFEFEPHERTEITDFVKGPEYKTVVRELNEYIRQKIKYGDLPDPVYDAYCEIRNKINELTEGLDVYE